ncbi:MAG: type II toxin-antitoxin system HicB family antitoxin, partial [Acetobacteraceae bacterium]|nr:type II toxin-antitoxin system HicB family antitoxin [Acetobacteraceae bacterium]
MATKYYLAIADRLPDESSWSITFPDFPGVTSVAEKFAELMRQAKDALASAVEDMERDGEALPPSIEDDALPN